MADSTCSHTECSEKVSAREMCRRHYGIAYRAGAIPPAKTFHRLAAVDMSARRAVCSICGPTEVLNRGHGRRQCATARRNERMSRSSRSKRVLGPPLSPAETDRRWRLKTKYGLTAQAYDALLHSQRGLCAICNEAPSGARRLAVDHDHETGEVRGLLCMSCNTGIGLFRDRSDLLLSATRYLSAGE